jgi:Acetyltransferases, including N-acetylases of ribosomal proteins
MYIETKRLSIRPFTMEDLQDVHEYCSQPEIGEFAGWLVHKSIQETTDILNRWITEGYKHAIVLKEKRKVIGHISIDDDSEEKRSDTKEIGCALNKVYQRQGIMTESIKATINSLFQMEQIEYIWACCYQINVASKGMIEKCGFIFQQEGVFDSKSLNKEFPSYEYRITKNEWKNLCI